MSILYGQTVGLQTFDIIKSVSNVREDSEIDNNNLISMAQTLYNGGILPDIYTRVENGRYACYDGLHRLLARRMCNRHTIPCKIMNISIEEARDHSYKYNCGTGWSEGKKARECCKLYKEGKDVKEIVIKRPDVGDETNVQKYIRIGHFLHPELLENLGKGGRGGTIATSTALILIRVDKNVQKEIYNKNNNKLTESKAKELIQNYRNQPSLLTDIKRSAPSQFSQQIQTFTPVPNSNYEINTNLTPTPNLTYGINSRIDIPLTPQIPEDYISQAIIINNYVVQLAQICGFSYEQVFQALQQLRC
jgi:hypothetical protein